MSNRSYLSIGDVLTLLRQEFPDVTISKIRFLESQGLVNPERSPSGYRKFYDHDVARLRWVLRQQRENFLPLKVIRDRLAQEGDRAVQESPRQTRDDLVAVGADLGAPGAPSPPEQRPESMATVSTLPTGPTRQPGGDDYPRSLRAQDERPVLRTQPSGGNQEYSLEHHPAHPSNGPPDFALRAEPESREERLPGVGSRAATPAGSVGTSAPAGFEQSPWTADDGEEAASYESGAARPPRANRSEAMSPSQSGIQPSPQPGIQPPLHQPAAQAGPAVHHPEVQPAAGSVAASTAGVGSDVPGVERRDAAGQSSGADQHGDADGAPASKTAQGIPPGQRPAAGHKAAGHNAAIAQANRGRGGRGSGFQAAQAATGASLTQEELCSAAGIDLVTLATLERFGLVQALVVAGVPYYDEDALTITRLAAQLAEYGVEPRHLTLYRNAVDREVGLVEQIVTPLLRQRNPESRQRAVETSTNVTRLGESLRSALLRRELHQQLGT